MTDKKKLDVVLTIELIEQIMFVGKTLIAGNFNSECRGDLNVADLPAIGTIVRDSSRKLHDILVGAGVLE